MYSDLKSILNGLNCRGRNVKRGENENWHCDVVRCVAPGCNTYNTLQARLNLRVLGARVVGGISGRVHTHGMRFRGASPGLSGGSGSASRAATAMTRGPVSLCGTFLHRQVLFDR